MEFFVMRLLLPFTASLIGLLVTGLIMWLLSFVWRETPPSAEAIKKNREFIERQAQKEVDTLEHFFEFEESARSNHGPNQKR
jgi:hypothetical protein